MTNDSDVGLLQRFIRSQDAEAFALITRQYAGLVYGTCIRITGNEARAADATQETFFHLAKHARQVRGSLAGWLHRVAVGKSVNLVRSDVARRRREEQYAAQPRETNEWSEISPLVDEALQELDEEQREILVRHYLQGETLTSLAGAKGISQPTVSRRAEQALEQLRERLRKKGVGVAATALGTMLVGTTQEAPAIVLAELGKMALVSTAAGAAGTVSVLGFNAKLVAAVAVAMVGVGGYVAYRVTQPVERTPVEPVPLIATQPTPASVPVAPTVEAQTPPTTTVFNAAGPTAISIGPAPTGEMAPLQSAGSGLAQRGEGSYGSMAIMAGDVGFGGMSAARPPSRATIEGALTKFANAFYEMAVGRNDLAQLEECFVGTEEREEFLRIWEDPANDAERELQHALRNLRPPIEIASTIATDGGVTVKWKATVRQSFTATRNGATKSWQQGERYELETQLKEISGEWKIVGF